MRCKGCDGTEFVQEGGAMSYCRRIIDDKLGKYVSDWIHPDKDTFLPETTKCLSCGLIDYQTVEKPINPGTMVPYSLMFSLLVLVTVDLAADKDLLNDEEYVDILEPREELEENIKELESLFDEVKKYTGIDPRVSEE